MRSGCQLFVVPSLYMDVGDMRTESCSLNVYRCRRKEVLSMCRDIDDIRTERYKLFPKCLWTSVVVENSSITRLFRFYLHFKEVKVDLLFLFLLPGSSFPLRYIFFQDSDASWQFAQFPSTNPRLVIFQILFEFIVVLVVLQNMNFLWLLVLQRRVATNHSVFAEVMVLGLVSSGRSGNVVSQWRVAYKVCSPTPVQVNFQSAIARFLAKKKFPKLFQ